MELSFVRDRRVEAKRRRSEKGSISPSLSKKRLTVKLKGGKEGIPSTNNSREKDSLCAWGSRKGPYRSTEKQREKVERGGEKGKNSQKSRKEEKVKGKKRKQPDPSDRLEPAGRTHERRQKRAPNGV